MEINNFNDIMQNNFASNRMNQKQINSIIWLINKRIEEIKKLLNLRENQTIDTIEEYKQIKKILLTFKN